MYICISLNISTDFILEAFKDQVSLHVLKFPDLLLLFQLVVFHGAADIM